MTLMSTNRSREPGSKIFGLVWQSILRKTADRCKRYAHIPWAWKKKYIWPSYLVYSKPEKTIRESLDSNQIVRTLLGLLVQTSCPTTVGEGSVSLVGYFMFNWSVLRV